MKEIIKKIRLSKSQIITIILAVAFSMVMSLETSYAADIIFDSKNVGFDNTGTKIQATTVQWAIDELYDAATDYSSMNTRVNGLEETIGDSTLTTTSKTLTGGINELNGKIATYAKITVISGTTNSYVGLATWNNISSYDFSNKWLVGIFVQGEDTRWYYLSHQSGNVASIAMDNTTRRPVLYVSDTSVFWFNKPCYAIYVS